MSIIFDEKTRCFKLDTPGSSYIMKITEFGYLQHLYYGARISDTDVSYLFRRAERPVSPYIPNGRERSFSLDTMPQEYSGNGTGDFRIASAAVRSRSGHNAVRLKYRSHVIYDGKKPLPGLPATYCGDAEARTLEIELFDETIGLSVTLAYSVFNELDAIARGVRAENQSNAVMYIEKLMSLCADFDDGGFDLLQLSGRWGSERHIVRRPLVQGKQSIESARGASSHQQNPFAALLRPGAGEYNGEVYGFSLVYSGNFTAEAELDQYGAARLVMGINPAGFEWELRPGARFTAPEAVTVFSSEGLSAMSHTFHKLYRDNLCRGYWKDKPRPVLANNWEATFFDFDDGKLLSLARDAAELGAEMFVMDDGWFGRRDDDESSLGDWWVNTGKLRRGLGKLVEEINALGLQFGIWFEPEMISEDSDLYRAHPDWILRVPGREPSLSRAQLVLDMSRADVRDYLFDCICKILDSANIIYIKWDFNRMLTEAGSALLPPERQKEVPHRFTLGTYELLERLIARYPRVLFEGCASGGGRFDPGMLYYTPQIWTSDNNDPIERLKIHEGTTVVYPMSCIAAHVPACPYHITGRVTDFATRGLAAYSGSFGYELDLNKLTAEEKEAAKQQIKQYRELQPLITRGRYYRLAPWNCPDYGAWSFVAEDKSEAFFAFVLIQASGNQPFFKVRLRGLDPSAVYSAVSSNETLTFSGDTLMNAGLPIPRLPHDGAAYSLHFKRLEKRRS